MTERPWAEVTAADLERMASGTWHDGCYVTAVCHRDRRGRPTRLYFWAIRPGRDSWMVGERSLHTVAERRGLGLGDAAAALANERKRPGWDVPALRLAGGGARVPCGARTER